MSASFTQSTNLKYQMQLSYFPPEVHETLAQPSILWQKGSQEGDQTDWFALARPIVPDGDPLSPYVQFMKGIVMQFENAEFLQRNTGAKAQAEGVQLSGRLQELLQRAGEKERSFLAQSTKASAARKQLIEDISSTSLPRKQSFAERKRAAIVDLETKKTQIARCVQMEDPEFPGSAAICIAHQLKGVPESQQKKLLDFVPSAYVGDAVNKLAAPFVVVSKVFKVISKVILHAGVNEGCLSTNPGDLRGYNVCVKQQMDIFEGRDPKMNQMLEKETPEVVKKGLRMLATADAKLEAFDRYMHDRYRTIQGFVHEGAYGMVDTALLVPWARVARGIAGSAANIMKTPFREAQETLTMRSLLSGFVKDEAGKVKIPEFSKLVRDRKLEFKDLGFPQLKVLHGNGREFDGFKYALDGRIIAKEGDLIANLNKVKIRETDLKNLKPKEIISNLKKIAREENAKRVIIRIDEEWSKDILQAMGKVYGNPPGRYRDKQIYVFKVRKSLKELSGTEKPYQTPQHAKRRYDYSSDYLDAFKEFVGNPKEFDGVLSRDLVVVQYHNGGVHNVDYTSKYFMPVMQGNTLHTVNEVMDAVGLLSKWGERSHVTVARIPSGESVRFIYGRAKTQNCLTAGELRPGGGVQYRFYDFDPSWIKETREIITERKGGFLLLE